MFAPYGLIRTGNNGEGDLQAKLTEELQKYQGEGTQHSHDGNRCSARLASVLVFGPGQPHNTLPRLMT